MGNISSRTKNYIKSKKDIENEYDTLDNDIKDINISCPVLHENEVLKKFQKYVNLDVRNKEIKEKCLKQINEDIYCNITYNDFLNKYKEYYPYFGQLAKTSYEISKTELILKKVNNHTSCFENSI